MKSRQFNGLAISAISLVAFGITACSESDDGNTIRLELEGASRELVVPAEIDMRNSDRNELADQVIVRNASVLVGDTDCVDLSPRLLSDDGDYSREIANAVGDLVTDGSAAISLFVQWSARAQGQTILLSDGEYDLGMLSMVMPDPMAEQSPAEPVEPTEVSLVRVETGCTNGESGAALELTRFDDDGDGLSNLEELNAGVAVTEIVGDTTVMVPRSGGNSTTNAVLNDSDPIVVVDVSSADQQGWSTLEELILCRVAVQNSDGTLASAFENLVGLDQPAPTCPRDDPTGEMNAEEMGQLPKFSIGAVPMSGDAPTSLLVIVTLAFGNVPEVMSNDRAYTELTATLDMGGLNAGADPIACMPHESMGSPLSNNTAPGFSVSCPIPLEGEFMVDPKTEFTATFVINGTSLDDQNMPQPRNAAWNLRQAGLFLFNSSMDEDS